MKGLGKGILMLGAAGGAFFVFSKIANAASKKKRKDERDKRPPDITFEAPPIDEDTGHLENSSSDLGAEFDAFHDALDQQEAEMWDNMISGATSGALVGAKIGGPIGAFVGAIVGWIVGAFRTIMGRETPKRPPIPWEEFGLPYRPDLADWNSDGSVSIEIPAPNIGATVKCKLNRSIIERLIPGGDSAIESCRKAGMFSWRPFDNANPVLMALHKGAKYLQEYEEKLLGHRGPGDVYYDGTWYRYSEIYNPNMEENEDLMCLRFIILARHLAFCRAYSAHMPTTTIYAEDVYPSAMNLREKYKIFQGKNISWFMSQYIHKRFEEEGGTNRYIQISSAVSTICRALNVPVWVCQSNYAGDCLLQNKSGGDWKEDFSYAKRGFPGAWRLRPNYQREEKKEEKKTTGIAKVIPLAPQFSTGSIGAMKFAAPKTTRGVRATSTSKNMGVIAKTEDRVKRTMAKGDIAEFYFEVWLPSGSRVVKSGDFTNLCGYSHRGVKEKLEAGELVWRPGIEQKFWEKWVSIDYEVQRLYDQKWPLFDFLTQAEKDDLKHNFKWPFDKVCNGDLRPEVRIKNKAC